MKTQPKQTGVWLDGKKAIIIDLINGQETVREIEADIDNPVHHKHQGKPGTFMGTQHVNDEKKFERRKIHETNEFLQRIMEELKTSDELYVIGPAEMKLALRKKIGEDKSFIGKFKALDGSDYISLNQVVAEVKNYFKNSR